ncbi:MAG TPA: Xaa-Pro peptidase family protein [Thermoleophilia bacterium]|nr:Xaa-Pro peptidase family protein [Thermoleophilia bacterium]
MNARLERCRALLPQLGVDGLLVSDPDDVRYLSGFRGDDATLLIGAAAASLCTDARYWEQVHEEVVDLELSKVTDQPLLAHSVAEAARVVGEGARLGYQGAQLSHASYRRLRRLHRGGLRDVAQHVTLLRAVKDDDEIAAMRRAAAVTDEALGLVVARGLVGRRERDVAWDLRAEYHRLGAEGEAFPAIVATGDHGAQAHALPGERIIRAGELVVIDTGARVDGYCSDITRTYAAGEPSGELRRLYDVVLEAQLAGLATVRAGAHGRRDVDAAARAVIEAAGYGDRFGHGTGHGVGRQVHEAPSLGRTRGDRLEAGMVCTVEPGIYLEGLAGVRIEDTVLVTADGCRRLTTSPKDLQVVG